MVRVATFLMLTRDLRRRGHDIVNIITRSAVRVDRYGFKKARRASITVMMLALRSPVYLRKCLLVSALKFTHTLSA
jgi:hypothetical protein